MHELTPGSVRKLLPVKTGETTPVLKADDLLELDKRVDPLGGYVSLVWNKEADRVYVEVHDNIHEVTYAIPVAPGQDVQAVYENPEAHLELMQQVANVEQDSAPETKPRLTEEDLRRDFAQFSEVYKNASEGTTEGSETRRVMEDNINFILDKAVRIGVVPEAEVDDKRVYQITHPGRVNGKLREL